MSRRNQPINLELRGLSFENDPEFAPFFYESIGRVAVLWGHFEFTLDSLLRMAIEIVEHREGTRAEMQLSFNRKTEKLRELYSSSQTFKDKSAAMKTFTKDADEAALDRNLIIHSNLEGWGADPLPRMHLQSYRFNGVRVEIRSTKPTIADLASLGAQITRLRARMLAEFISPAVPLQRSRETD